MIKSILFRQNKLGIFICAALTGISFPVYSVEFNTDILAAEDRDNIDLSHFEQAGYIMPGTYFFALRINEQTLVEQSIAFKEFPTVAGGPTEVRPCLTRKQVALLGLKPGAMAQVLFDESGSCADFSALEGITLRGSLADSALFISVPQSWLEYQDSTWLPPSRWENGIPGIMLDYSLNTGATKSDHGNQSRSASGNGTLGANLDAWRLRGDWQGQYNHSSGRTGSTQQRFSWTRLYAYRALPKLMAKLLLGETYLSSDLFDSWRFSGAALLSDEAQLPPRLRGYAPEVTGIARTNAKVVISQHGRVLYESSVAAGPFRIQELNSAVNGQLDVRVEEQDGSVQTFEVTTATVPYLTRPGQMRYKLAAGRPSDYNHHADGPLFGSAEASWGVSNSWSLYGGGIFSPDYQSLALGLGRDLFHFGALSADITQSVAQLPQGDRPQGRSYRVSYSKRFDAINSDLTFAGYRFSEREFLSMSEYLSARMSGTRRASSKELYTITASKNFTDARFSTHLSWSHQTYWDRPQTNHYNLSASRYFDMGSWRNLSATLSASRSDYDGRQDDALWLSMSVPLGNGTLSYNGNWNDDRFSQTAGWYQRLDNHDSYRLNAGTRNGNGEALAAQVSGYYTHSGDMTDMNASLNWQQNSYTSASLSLNGGLTVTTEGAALHGSGGGGVTRMLVSTDGVPGVPVGRNGKTNRFGIAVDPSVASYYRTTTEIDVTRLPDDVETAGSPVVEAALTEGAIGFRRFEVLQGAKVVAVLSRADGSHPPFGASIRNAKSRDVGMVSDGGLAWISGINPNEQLTVSWGAHEQCTVSLPPAIPAQQQLLLPCLPTDNDLNRNTTE